MIYIILSIICVVLLIALFKKRSNYNEEILQEQRQLESLKKEELNRLNSIKRLEERERDYEAFFKSEDRRKQTYVEQQKMACDLELEAYRVSRKSEIDQRLITLQLTQENECKERYKKFDEQQKQSYNIKWQELEAKINQQTLILQGQEQLIAEYKAKQDAINEEIRRKREVEEKEEFYKIQISADAKQDINYLLSIVNHFNNKEVIYKLIWSEYIQKSFKSMLNRVLANKDPKNVIYMIQNTTTKETYIGKTKSEVSKRWTEHIKTSLNIGSISNTKIHPALFNNWDNFIFSILEEVPDEASLSEREKYYINFYQSDIYGYNIKSGG